MLDMNPGQCVSMGWPLLTFLSLLCAGVHSRVVLQDELQQYTEDLQQHTQQVLQQQERNLHQHRQLLKQHRRQVLEQNRHELKLHKQAIKQIKQQELQQNKHLVPDHKQDQRARFVNNDRKARIIDGVEAQVRRNPNCHGSDLFIIRCLTTPGWHSSGTGKSSVVLAFLSAASGFSPQPPVLQA